MSDTLATPHRRQNGAKSSRIATLLRGLALPVAFLIGWSVLAESGLVKSRLLVPLDEVLLAPFIDPIGIHLWSALGGSLHRMAVGFALGAAAGVLLGLLTGMSPLAQTAIMPSFNAVRQVTLFAWIPLLTGWFGIGDGSKFVYIALSAFFPIALNTFNGLRTIPVHHIEVARVLRLPARQRILRLYLPGALPSIFVGFQIALITSWLGTVGSEYAMGNGPGLGSFLAEARDQFRMDIVLAGVAALAAVGFGFSFLFRRAFLYFAGARAEMFGRL